MTRPLLHVLLGAALGVGAAAPPARAQQPAPDTIPEPPRIPPESLPLFASHDVLEIRLVGDLTNLKKDRDAAEEHPAELSFRAAGDSVVTLQVQCRTRGNLRLQRRICSFPNFRLNLKKKEVRHTVFDGQDKLKVVAHCQDKRGDYEENTIQEYLLYRVFNLLSDVSFRVRLARITYVNTHDDKLDSLTRYAFFIEDDDHLAARHGLSALDVPAVPPDVVDWDYLGLVSVFQYMIGNTDWSAFMREPHKEECCHNTRPIGTHAGPVLPVPYDFDVTGAVNPRYAVPNKGLPINSVRHRLYRGFCQAPQELAPVFQRFNGQREAIYALVRDAPGLREKAIKEMLEYFDEFYEIINDPKAVDRKIHRDCRRLG